ncbi:hypothetical protein ASF24_09905 [Methylobacterium sp. Leaf86]|uniref:DUF805 domain-containing protein n=1 Tax=Methylobacterium sp. Leaf86 TaxID=1736242 RepID=UPI0006F381E5|nr:hypothetical protein [Methylobacterium sp. Leaf86]KQO49441.1 hypothetical protein ASF24_09905 [Methylobacterium sp. Leaf86]
MNSYLSAMRSYRDFSGRTSRGDYWRFILVYLGIAVIALMLDAAFATGNKDGGLFIGLVHRKMLYRDLTSGEWLDGSTVSGEALVMTAFNALCPGVDPEASFGLVYRDPGAQYPRELVGRWFDDRRACRDPRRNQPDYDEYGVLTISPLERSGTRDFEFPQKINAVRRIGQAAWEVDGSHTIDDVEEPEIFGTTTYTLTRAGLSLRRAGTT